MEELTISTRTGRTPREKVQGEDARIAYFSMEIGINNRIPTYSGGLGVLAGDTIKSFADLSIPAVAVTLLYKKGYFYQKLGPEGRQQELAYEWKPEELLTLLPERTSVTVEGRTVVIQAWRYMVSGISEHSVPVIFLDTDLEPNSEYDRSLSYSLYGGDERYRLCQEVILGIGGVRMLQALGFASINHYHMNEGHASLLTLELLKERRRDRGPAWDIEGVRLLCVFTTHTPVPAGHDKFPYALVRQVLGDFLPLDVLQQCGGQDRLNMTLLALNLSHYINGVAKEHGKVSREMFPGYSIDSITNGIHSHTWVSEHFRKLFNDYIPSWANDPFSLRYAVSIPSREIWEAHRKAKQKLLEFVASRSNVVMEENAFTIGFARRSTEYKRADLIFFDLDRLTALCRARGPLQLVFAGKAHPRDQAGRELIGKITTVARRLEGVLKV
ncbi:MAG: alpha-glucan family phosphorylase, partial [Endomicrobiales bacterium]